MVNGAIGVVSYLLCRIAKWPLVVLILAAQQHHYNVVAAAMTLRTTCWVGMGLDMAFCLYWFVRIIDLASRTLKADKKA